MSYIRQTGLGDAQANSNAPGSFWAGVVQFFNPSIPTSTLTANYYQGVQYGSVPTIPEPSATTTPADQATAVQQAISDAESAGTYQTNPALGITATDISNNPGTTLLIAAAVIIGIWSLFGGRRLS